MARYTIDTFASYRPPTAKGECGRSKGTLAARNCGRDTALTPASPQSPLAARNTRTFQPSSPCQLSKSGSRGSLRTTTAQQSSSLHREAESASSFFTPLKKEDGSIKLSDAECKADGRSRSDSMPSTAVSSNPAVPKPLSRDAVYREHLFATFQALKFVRSLPPQSPSLSPEQVIPLPPTTLKTVVFDLDETLVHCIQDAAQADTAISVTFPTGETVVLGVNVRPFARECLAAVSAICEVVVFTASQRCYADAVLDYLDPSHQWVKHRFYRESCQYESGVYLKDLRVLGNRRLEDIIIVDNAAYSFAYQLDNGIPIVSWYDDREDCELRNLVAYLRRTVSRRDVREGIRETFKLAGFYEQYYRDFIRPSNNFA